MTSYSEAAVPDLSFGKRKATIVTFEVLTLSYLSLCVAVAFNADTPIHCCKMREAKKTLTYGI